MRDVKTGRTVAFPCGKPAEEDSSKNNIRTTVAATAVGPKYGLAASLVAFHQIPIRCVRLYAILNAGTSPDSPLERGTTTTNNKNNNNKRKELFIG